MCIPCKLLSLYTHNPVFIKNALVNNVITVWENIVKHTNFILEFLGLQLPVCAYEINSDSYIVAFCFFVSSYNKIYVLDQKIFTDSKDCNSLLQGT